MKSASREDVNMNSQFDVIVIGGGLLGCFAARNLTQYHVKAAIIEQREDVCTGISKANTAIIYSGYETKPGTLKTEMCVNANHKFSQLCKELQVRFRRCGSIMVAFGERGERILHEKFNQGIENAVPGIRLLSREEVLQMEPNLNKDVVLGLYSPTSGVVNPWELGIAAWENATANGCRTFFSTKVLGIEKEQDLYTIKTNKGNYSARGIINCAGLHADEIQAHLAEATVRILPSSADYYVTDTKTGGHVNHIIFHEPEKKGKGLTIVPTIDHNLLLGPSEVYGEMREAFATSEEGLAFIRCLAAKVIPDLNLSYIIRSFASRRPNPYYIEHGAGGELGYAKKSISSFVIQEADDDGCFIGLVGIKTPGLTCSDELGGYVVKRLLAKLGLTKQNEAFDPNRPASVILRELPIERRNELIQENPAYGRIICRCSGISEGEAIDAIRRGATTVDAVKRRAGTGMGRCQGSFCMNRIIELLSRELGQDACDIEKDGPGSWIIAGTSDAGV